MPLINRHRIECGTFELAKALTCNPVRVPIEVMIPVIVGGYGNCFMWPLVPLDYPDLNPKTYKRTVRG